MFNILSFQSDQHGMVAGLCGAECCRATILTSTTEEPPSCFYCKFYIICVSISVKPAAKWEAYHSPPSSVEVKNVWIFTSTSPHFFMMWCLSKQWQCRLLLAFVFCRNILSLLYGVAFWSWTALLSGNLFSFETVTVLLSYFKTE